MLLLSYAIQHYFAIPYESFTDKIITAYALLKIVDNVNEEDIKRIRYIQENTHKDICVSIWKLDRAINPVKGSFRTTTNKRKFKKNNASEDEIESGAGYVTLDEDIAQHYLCEAINEVHCIIIKNIKEYKEEMKMGMFDNEGDEGMNIGFTTTKQ